MRHKYSKLLYTNKPGGSLPQLVVAENENLQSRFVVQKVLELRENGLSLKDIAILFRSSFLSFDLEIELTKAGIAFQKFGGFKFIETAHIKDVIAYLRVLDNPRDVVAWNRILMLVDGVGPRTAERVIDDIITRKLPSNSSDFWEHYQGYPENVRTLFSTFKRLLSEKNSPSERVAGIINYYHPIFKNHYDDFIKRGKDLEMFEQIAARYSDTSALLTDLALEPPTESIYDMSAPTPDDELLTLSTIHSAKGLEWNSVFIIYALDGRFPSIHAANNPEELEEERRLMYVACTRAKENLIITYPINIYERESGVILSKPSRFLEGLDEKLLEPWVINE
jgi:DNA helicase-2/ATP-dependent DNA helicase PcrA